MFDEIFDILVVGAGPAGLAAALALGRAGWRVALAGRPETGRNGHTVALLGGSIGYLESLGIGPSIRSAGARIEGIRICDDTGSPFAPPAVVFPASDAGLDALGYNVETAELSRLLSDAVRASPGVVLVDRMVTGYAFEATQAMAHLDGGGTLRAALVVAADGRKSPARRAAGIKARTWDYPQSALTALVAHERPHHNISTEFQTRHGPFTLVPMPPLPDAPHRSSLVWLMAPRDAERRFKLNSEDLTQEIEEQAHFSFGRMGLEGPRGIAPMSGLMARSLTAARIALIAEAAHAFPPVAAQGLNLSLRDVAQLVEVLSNASHLGQDLGGPEALAAYSAARRSDIALRALWVDLLNRALLDHNPASDLVRGAGLRLLGLAGPLRRLVMRQGLALPPAA